MTLDEMANNLGVSKSTVSRALSGKGRIGKETRERILSFAREQGALEETDKPAGLVSTCNIGVVLPADAYANRTPYFQDCLLGICEVSSLMKYNVLVATGIAHDPSSIRDLVENGKVDGIILTRSMEGDKAVQYLTDIHFPVGMTGVCGYDEVIQVDIDNKAASENLTTLLIGRGYKKFALIVEDLAYQVNQSRYDGFCNALLKNGISKQSQCFYTGALEMEFLDTVISDLMIQKVECIICGDDVICSSVMSRLQADGYRIPKDIAIPSLYNSPSLSCFSPAITTVSVSVRQIGNMIGKQMINYLQGNEYDKKTMMDYEILFRKSTNRVRAE